MSKFTVIKVAAPRDPNGNPRTYYIVYDAKGEVVEHYELGYNGAACITNNWHLQAWYDRPICFEVSIKELKRVLKSCT